MKIFYYIFVCIIVLLVGVMTLLQGIKEKANVLKISGIIIIVWFSMIIILLMLQAYI